MGRLLGIANHVEKRGEMQLFQRAVVTVEAGVEADFRGRPGPRQVTVLTREGWEAACRDAGCDLPWTARRANLLVEGLALGDSVGRLIRIGGLVLKVSRETDPCERMDETFEGLGQALASEWRGGVCCQVVHSGEIGVGDEVEIGDET